MLISELLGGKITEALGLKIPELVFMNLDVDLEERKQMKKFRIC
jgi:hypothetical protein